jgi:hypothetical protein
MGTLGLACALIALGIPATAGAHDDAVELTARQAAEGISSDGRSGPATLTGTVQRIHAHDGDFDAEFFWALSTKFGPIPIRLTDGSAESLELERVRVDGELRDGVLVAGADDVEVDGPPASTDVAAGPRRVAVVLYYVSPDHDGAMTTPPSYFNAATLEDVVFDSAPGSTSVNNYFKTQTFGHVTFPGTQADVFGPYAVEDPAFDSGHTGCHFLNWWTRQRPGPGTDAGSAYEQARDEYEGTHGPGSFDATYQHIAYVLPGLAFAPSRGPGCGGGGVGEQPGRQIWVDSPYSFIMYHELGHNLGSGHAHTARCSEGATPVAYATGCDSPSNPTYGEYGDPFDPMGGSGIMCFAGCEMNASRKLGFGALAGGSQTVSADGTFNVAPLEASSGLRLLRIPKPDGRFFDVSVRAPIGTFDGASYPGAQVLGVSIHSDDAAGGDSYAIDAHPDPAGDLSDMQFRAGDRFAPYAGTTVTVNSVSAAGASITVDVPDQPGAGGTCIVPKVKRKKLRQAKGLIADAGCELGKVKKKRSKKPKGKVLKQSPKPGTDAGPGGQVKLTVAR